jgi:translocation and assembly module TamB
MAMQPPNPAPADVVPAVAPAPAAGKRRRGLWAALLGVVGLCVALVFAAGAWLLHTEGGAVWALARLPGVTVVAARGSLLGDFSAERVEIAWPGHGGTSGSVVLHAPVWQGLQLQRTGDSRWLRVVIGELRAQRVELRPPPPSPAPPAPPRSLALPVELVLQSLRVDRVDHPALGERPLREVDAELHLGAQGGASHALPRLRLRWERIVATAQARVATTGSMDVQATLRLDQDAAPGAPGAAVLDAWRADARLDGPLAALQVAAVLRAAPAAAVAAGPAAPTVEAGATLLPFAAWPLPELTLRTEALDLSALHPGWPVTALTGSARLTGQGLARPAALRADLANAVAGRWNEGRVPLRRLQIEAGARPDDLSTIDLQTFVAEFGSRQQAAGTARGTGRWSAGRWTLTTTLEALQPALLDARAPVMSIGGPVSMSGSGFGAADLSGASIDAKAELAGQFTDRGQARQARVRIDAGLGAKALTLRELVADSAGASATVTGTLARPQADGPWRASGRAALVDFDPLPWWPGRDGAAWRQGPHKLNAQASFDLQLPAAALRQPGAQRLAALRGEASATVSRSLLAGVPLAGSVRLRNAGAAAEVELHAELDGNRLQADGRVAPDSAGAADRWTLSLAAPALQRLAPLWRLLATAPGGAAPAGAVQASARVEGRWPRLSTQGQLIATGLRVAGLGAQQVQARWQAGTTAGAPLNATLSATQAVAGSASVETAELQLEGTARAHSLSLRAQSKALPPAWAEEAQAAVSGAIAAPAQRSVAALQGQGGFFDAGGVEFAGWRGVLQKIELRGDTGMPWLRGEGIAAQLQWDGGAARLALEPGALELLGSKLRWTELAWQAGDGQRSAARGAIDATLDPIRVAPALARLQPDFGWGGDLAVGGRINVRSAPTFTADVVLERSSGDLTVTDEAGTQSLGLTDLRLGLAAADGVWSFTQGLAGATLGVAAGAVVVRTSPTASWPDAATPIQGVLELQVANLGTWGAWVPAGWRLGGALRVGAAIGGRFDAPEYTGELRGTGLSVRNFVEGVNVTDGDLQVALQGTTARIERFTAKAGAGTARLEGQARLGEAPQADLRLVAERFQLLGRVDRRIVASGEAQLRLDRDTLALQGRFGVDEGLVDFSRGDAPSLSDDVVVERVPLRADKAAEPGPSAAAPLRRASRLPRADLDLRVGLGQRLRLRGRGLDTLLRGELRVTSPGGRLALNGTIDAGGGTYAAYGQKLSIDRGQLVFTGASENPRLEIEATRPNIDVRVGVAVRGTALAPRVRLFSEPELPEVDKLSWLVLGRPSDGLGSTETALLQRTALALLAGEGDGVSGQLLQAIGLDELSVRQTDGEVRETVISLGKQLSRRWYVGYERGLNATTGTWQLVYRLAQRLTLRAQSGVDNSLDAIFTWRWQ